MNLTQLLVTQQNVDMLSQQFGLSEEETLEAMGALIPAFSTGLKRNASTPQGAAGFIETLATGRHGHYAENNNNAATSFGVREGNAILGHLFGSKDVSRAVADQASAASGVGSSILKQMLPVIASLVMGSLFKGATSSQSSRSAMGSAAGGGLLGQLIEGLAGGMLGGAGGTAPPSRRRASRRSAQQPGLEGILGELLGGALGGASSRRAPRRTRRRASPTAQGRRSGSGGIFDELMGGESSRGRRRQNPYAQPQRKAARPRRRSGGGLGNIFGELLEAGGNTSSDYQRQTGSVFDQFLGPN